MSTTMHLITVCSNRAPQCSGVDILNMSMCHSGTHLHLCHCGTHRLWFERRLPACQLIVLQLCACECIARDVLIRDHIACDVSACVRRAGEASPVETKRHLLLLADLLEMSTNTSPCECVIAKSKRAMCVVLSTI